MKRGDLYVTRDEMQSAIDRAIRARANELDAATGAAEMNNADMASVLLRGAGMFSENLQRLHRNESMAYTEEAFFALAAELDKSATPQKMPGVLDIPGVKDYVNATPPVPDQNLSAVPSNEGAGGSGPAAGLCEHDWDAGFIGPVSGTHQRKCLKCGAWKDPMPADPSSNAALDEAIALDEAMWWLEVRSEGQALTIIDHINKQAERIAELATQLLDATGENKQLAADLDALRARVAELEAEKERDEVSDWMRACAAQAERIAELTRNYNSLVLTSASEAATLEAERDALRAERDGLLSARDDLGAANTRLIAENERLRAWKTWGKDVALPAMVSGDWKRIDAAIVSAPKDAP